MNSRLLVSLFALVFLVSACSSNNKHDDASMRNYPVDSMDAQSSNLHGDVDAMSNNIIPGSQEDLIINIGDRVFFDYDSSTLSADAQNILTAQARWLNRYPHVTITVEGHCDERGTREYNLALGERRAASVRNYLVSSGVASNRISVISYGKERPELIGSNEEVWAQNRRGVVVVN